MEDKYLDKVFQDKLESTQHFDFDETAWDNLAARLEDEPSRRIIPWQWFAAAGIVLPLLLSSVYLFLQLKQTERTVAKLEEQVDGLAENIPVENIETKNTLVNKNIETTSISQPVINISVSGFKNETKIIAKQAIAAMDKTITKQKEFISKIITNNKEVEHKENSTIVNAVNNPVYGEQSNYLNKIVYTSAAIDKRPRSNKKIEHWIKEAKVLEVKESNWDKAKVAFIPVGFEVGTAYQTGVTLAQDLSMEQHPYFNNKGVTGAINFVNNVDLTLGANYSTASFETQTIGQDFPHVLPNNPTDIFQKVVVSENRIQIPVGLKYNFGDYDAVFSPFVEVGAIAKKVVQKSHRYEYQPNTPGNNFYAVLPKPEPVSESLEMNTVTGTIGVTWNPDTRILNNVMLQAEVFTAADIENVDAPVTMVGVGVSAKYMF